MKIVAVLAGRTAPGPIYQRTRRFHSADRALQETAKRERISVVRVFFEDWSPATGVFEASYVLSDEKEGAWVRQDRSVRPTLIWDRSSFHHVRFHEKMSLHTKIPLVNNPHLSWMCAKKVFLSLFLADDTPQTYLVARQAKLAAAVRSIESEEVVIKPNEGSAGEGVWIGPKDEAAQYRMHGPVLVQALIDTTAGIAGIVDGVHDLRLMYVGDRLVDSYVRTPAIGKRTSNLAQGGSMIQVPLERVPSSAMRVAQRFLDQLDAFPIRCLSIDFLFDRAQKPWIVECNVSPAFRKDPPYDQKEQQQLIEAFIRHIQEAFEYYELV